MSDPSCRNDFNPPDFVYLEGSSTENSCYTSHEYAKTLNYNDIKYIRADIAAEREKKLIEYAFDNGVSAVLEQIRYAEPPIFCPESDVEAAYYQSGLGKLK